jgi:hypothetical protein
MIRKLGIVSDSSSWSVLSLELVPSLLDHGRSTGFHPPLDRILSCIFVLWRNCDAHVRRLVWPSMDRVIGTRS